MTFTSLMVILHLDDTHSAHFLFRFDSSDTLVVHEIQLGLTCLDMLTEGLCLKWRTARPITTIVERPYVRVSKSESVLRSSGVAITPGA